MKDLSYLVTQATKQNIDWPDIEAALSPFVVRMSRTAQDPIFHGEGDVWTHTKLVCEALVELDAFRCLPEDAQLAVFWAALLHDIGKAATTRWEDNRWTSPHHAPVGSKMAREFLWLEQGLCGTLEKQQLRETVCLLIRYHSVPPHAIDDPEGTRKLIAIAANGQLCPMFTLKLLCILSRADALGRHCPDTPRMLEQVALCAELAKEHDCYEAPFPFPSDHTRYSYLAGRDIPAQLELYDDTWGDVIVLSGLPGTGKDTWIRENCPTLPMISLDEIRKEMNISPTENQNRVAEIAKERAKELLRKKQPFVWNATNLSTMIRGKQLRLFAQYGAAVRIVYLETDWEEQLRRNAARADAVPEQALYRMLEELIPPEAKEAHRVQWYCLP